MSYNSRIYREQGGSVMTFASGASLNFDAGAKLGGTYSVGAGSHIYDSGALVTFQAGASLTINQSGPSATVLAFAAGTSLPSISAGEGVPTHTAAMGSLYIRANGSVSNIYQNTSQDAAGSVWRLSSASG